VDKTGACVKLNLLLINSGDSGAFAALTRGREKTVFYASEFVDSTDQRSKKPDKLIHCVQSLSGQTGFDSIDAIAVTIGPGSFTGIRVGLSIAKGMAFALGVKLIPIGNFELAINRVAEILKGREYCILLPAKLPEYYYSVFRNGMIMLKGCVFIENLKEIIKKDTLIVGDFDDESKLKHHYFEYINLKYLKSELDSMFELAERGFNSGNMIDAGKTEPVYLKDFNIINKARN
jgi:tRNA threonylcarbamoyladenosine biosynthesis protein TsaB